MNGSLRVKLMNNSVFKKMNARKHRDIKLLTIERRESHLLSQPNYHKTKRFPEKVSAIEMSKTKLKMTKPEYLGLSILDISKMAIHEYWYDYVKPKYVNKTKLCYMDTDSFVVHIKQEHCVKSIQIRSFFWSVFSRISPYSVRIRRNTDQKKLCIWTLFTQWKIFIQTLMNMLR